MSYKRITLNDVAKEAGVSYATVSVVLSNKSGKHTRVSSLTKEKVLEVASRLGYVPNQSARELRSGLNTTIAVFTYENIFPVDSRGEFYYFFVGIQEEAAKNGYDLLILNNKIGSRVTSATGAIMIGLNRDDKDLLMLAKRNFPMVFTGRREIEGIEADYVTFDYKRVIEEFVSRTISFSRDKSIIFLSSDGKQYEPSEDKYLFLLQACQSNSILLKNLHFSADEAFFNNIVSSGVVFLDRIFLIDKFEKWCKERNLIIGKDIKAIVLEDDWIGKYSHWSRWENSRKELGSVSVRELLYLLDETRYPKPNRLVGLAPIYSETFSI